MKAEKMKQHPLFPPFNTLIEFDRLTPELLESAESRIISETNSRLSSIIHSPDAERTFDNTVRAFDLLGHEMANVLYTAYLMSSVHPDDAIRKTAEAVVTRLSQYMNELSLNEDLYQAVKAYSQSEDAARLTGVRAKLLDETIRDFERNGFALPKSERDVLKTYLDRMSEVSMRFHANIAESSDVLLIDAADTAGLPPDYLEARKQDDGRYKITLDYPSYVPFMKYAENGELRQELYQKYLNRAADTNPAVLQELIDLRWKIARLLGHETYAAYGLETKMAKEPQQVWDFLEDLRQKVAAKAEADYQILLNVKNEIESDAAEVYPWEKSFLTNRLMNTEYRINPEEIKTYFVLENVIEGLFTITGKLFGIDFEYVDTPHIWHPDVKLIEVASDGAVIGRFYMDLFPRPNKYNHAAMFGLLSGCQTDDGYQLPTAALVCNFATPTESQPSLLYHDDVVTLFHEFGHNLHHMLTRAEFASYSGTSVVRDYVETPSQLLENWAWEYESVKTFARHVDSGEVMPEALFQKLLDARHVNSGIDTQQQLFYGMLDMTYFDRFDPDAMDVSDPVRKLQGEVTLFPHVEGTRFEMSFGHLDGYAAGYYGYLWSKVFAEDVFDQFRSHGLMDARLGHRLRERIMSVGGSVEEMEQLKNFLGREPKSDAFIRSLGLTTSDPE